MPALEAVVVAWPVLEKFTLPVLVSYPRGVMACLVLFPVGFVTERNPPVHTCVSLSTRYKMPRVIGKVEGRGNGIKTVIFNVMDLSLALKRDPGEVCKFFGTELGAQVRE